MTHRPTTAEQTAVQAATAALTVSLTNDSPTWLGQPTHLNAGINLTGSSISDWQWTNTNMEPNRFAGRYTSLAIGTDGLTVISYYDGMDNELKVAKCLDAACTIKNITTVDNAGNVGLFTSLAIGANGLPVISYYDRSKLDLKVAQCLDAACTTKNIIIVDSAGNVGLYTSLAIGADGLPVISYYDQTNLDLKVAQCQDVNCTSAITTTVDSASEVGLHTALAIGVDGLPIISYYDQTNGDLKVAKCQNTSCTNAISTTVDSAGDVGLYTSLAVGIDGLPVISYYDQTNGDLKVAKCQNTSCTSAISTTVDSTGDIGQYTSLEIGADGLPVISYHDQTNLAMKVAKCLDVACMTAISTTVNSASNGGLYNSLAIGPDELPVISYFNDTSDRLTVAKALVTLSYTLVYGDGVTETGRYDDLDGHGLLQSLPFTHTYAPAGNYIAVLTVTSGLSTSTVSSVVAILAPPVPKVVTLTNDSPTVLGGDTHFTATRSTGLMSGLVDYALDYGDGSPVIMGIWSADPWVFTRSYSTTGTYIAAGTYTAILTVTDGVSTVTTSSLVTITAPPALPPLPITVTLTNDSPTMLGAATQFTASLSRVKTLAAWQWISTAVDITGNVGTYSALAIGADGLPIISYQDLTNYGPHIYALKVAKCETVSCTRALITAVDATGGDDSSVAIGIDGLPVISYQDQLNADLKVAKCETVSCTRFISTTLDAQWFVGLNTALAIGMDGLPVISYSDDSNFDLKVAKCETVSCTSALITTVDTTGVVGNFTSLAIGADGLPIISYHDTTNRDLKVAKCETVSCSRVLSTTLDAVGQVGDNTSLAIGSDGLPVISYRDASHNDLKVAKCQTVSCTTALSTTVDTAGGFDTSVAIGVDKLPVISYRNTSNHLKLAQCQTVSCTSVMSVTLDAAGAVGFYSALAIGADGLPIISYYDANNGDLKVAKVYLQPITYTLTYGDGTSVVTGTWPADMGTDLLPFTHTYVAAGTYTAILTATDGVSTSTSSSIVTITEMLPVVEIVTLTNDSPVVLGSAAQFTATRSIELMKAMLYYNIDYGDGSPVMTGAWTSDPLPLSHIYAQAGSYTVLLTATKQVSDNIDLTAQSTAASIESAASTTEQIAKPMTATTRVTVQAVDLIGDLSYVLMDRQVTYTLVVTNANANLPATNVVVSGSLPANANLVNAFGALSIPTGGDYGTGYVQSSTPVTLLPGQAITLQWAVQVNMLTGDVTTRGHATSDSSTLDFETQSYLYRIFLPIIRKDAILLN